MNRLTASCILLVGLCTTSLNASTPPAAPPEILEGIRLAEYEFAHRGNAFTAPNRAHGFRIHIDSASLVLTDRLGGNAAWRIEMRPHRFGRDGALQAVAPGSLRANGARIENVRPGFVEWYLSSSNGLEQGFDIERPPAGDRSGPLILEFALTGNAQARMEGKAVVLDAPGGGPVLRYDSLVVHDANGRQLEATLTLAARTVRMEVQDEFAAYPLTIDPLFTTPSLTIPGENGDFGYSVATADVDGDNYADLIVGAPNYDAGEVDEGKVHVFLGGSGTIGFNTTPDWTAVGGIELMNLGYAVANAGRVNTDIYDDIIVGAPRNSDQQQPLDGYAFIWFGSSTGLGAPGNPDNANWVATTSGHPGAWFGAAVAGGGDVNGDSWDDVMVGAPRYENNPDHQDEGWVFVYHGGPGGPSTTHNWSAQAGSSSSPHRFSQLGYAVALGNLDGDAFDDAIVGAPYFKQDNNKDEQGNVFVWLGSSSNGLNNGTNGLPGNADWRAKSDLAFAHLGVSVLAVHTDYDAYDDVVAGAPDYDSRGAVFLWRGSAGFKTANNGDPGNAWWKALSLQVGVKFGASIAAADLLAGGVDSIIAGAPNYSGGKGAAFAWHGCPIGALIGTDDTAHPDWSYFHQGAGAQFGQDAIGLGPINAAGFDAVALGAPGYNAGQGQVLVFTGDGDPPSVEVLAPNGGQSLNIGTQTILQWFADCLCFNLSTVDVQLSRNGPNGPFETLFLGTSNDDSQPWIVSGPDTNNAYLRVLATGPGGVVRSDISDAAFTIGSDPSCGPCPQSYCQSVGTRCTFNGSCGPGGGGCCNFSCNPDITCEQEDLKPVEAC